MTQSWSEPEEFLELKKGRTEWSGLERLERLRCLFHGFVSFFLQDVSPFGAGSVQLSSRPQRTGSGHHCQMLTAAYSRCRALPFFGEIGQGPSDSWETGAPAIWILWGATTRGPHKCESLRPGSFPALKVPSKGAGWLKVGALEETIACVGLSFRHQYYLVHSDTFGRWKWTAPCLPGGNRRSLGVSFASQNPKRTPTVANTRKAAFPYTFERTVATK